jgi:hypothetical protein
MRRSAECEEYSAGHTHSTGLAHWRAHFFGRPAFLHPRPRTLFIPSTENQANGLSPSIRREIAAGSAAPSPFANNAKSFLPPLLVRAGFPIGGIEMGQHWPHDAHMRVNLSTRPFRQTSTAGRIPVTLSIRTARGLSGDYECPMDGEALLRMLRQQTDLPGYVLDVFARKLRTPADATLPGVELSETLLTEIGYFVD